MVHAWCWSPNDNPAVHVWDLRAIRKRLAEMGLDWDAPAYSDDDPAAAALPPLQVDLGPLAGEMEHFTESPQALLKRYTTRLKHDPNDALAYHHRGHALYEVRRLQAAIDDFDIAFRLCPDDAHLRASLAEACNNWAWLLAYGPCSRREAEHALVLSRRAVELCPNHLYYVNTFGIALYRAGQYAQAISTLERYLVECRGEQGGFELFFVAMALHRQGRGEQARASRPRRPLCREPEKPGRRLADLDGRVPRETEAVLAGPAGELPAKVFAPHVEQRGLSIAQAKCRCSASESDSFRRQTANVRRIRVLKALPFLVRRSTRSEHKRPERTVMVRADVAIIGGGIVGLATAYQLTRTLPGRKVVVLEKESELAQHQTGHNSGVLHSGIYYKPGSLKATNCRQGKGMMQEVLRRRGDSLRDLRQGDRRPRRIGVARAGWIFDRGQANGVACEVIGRERLSELEPHAAGIKAIHVPEAGIVNYKQVCQRMAERIGEADGQILTSARVTRIDRGHDNVVLTTTDGEVEAQQIVNCTRASLRPRDGHERAEAGRQDHPVPRRILRAQARGASPLQSFDLSGPRPGLPVPGRPLHPDDRRGRGVRPERRAGIRP